VVKSQEIRTKREFDQLSLDRVLAIRWPECVADGEMVTKSGRQKPGCMVVVDVAFSPIELSLSMFAQGGYFEVISR
jgi:hypothetical protein